MKRRDKEKRPAAVVLAAGFSKRMGKFKPLLPLEGTTVIGYVISQLKAAGIEKIFAVTGYRSSDIENEISGKAEIVFNPDFEKGMFTSIRRGILAAKEDEKTEGAFLVPVDCPAFGTDTVKKMLQKIDDRFAVPVYMGKKGHPLFIPKSHFDEIAAYRGSGGLKGITDRYFEEMQRIPVKWEGCVMDMDTPGAYSQIKGFLAQGSGPGLLEMAKGRRFILVRHGRIRQHREKIFLGRTDVPLDETGRMQAEQAALAIEKIDPDADVIYTSPLKRAKETASIVSRRGWKNCPAPKVAEEEGFREIDLGEWDGMSIGDVRKKYPKEYEMRGRNIFSFKIGNHSENFFDVQYRSCKALKKILEKDRKKDLIITAHKSVLRSIENNIKGLGVEDDWDRMKNGEVRIINV